LHRTHGTAEHLAGPFLVLGLPEIMRLQIGGEPGEWIERRGETAVEPRLPVFGPHLFQRRHGQIGLRLKEIVETPFLHIRTLADVINGDRAIALLPHEGECGVFQPLVGVRGSSHDVETNS
jgi:hypothetical protein